MAKQIIWSNRAKDSLKEILFYWKQRNKTSTYSKKLTALIKESIKTIEKFPYSGKVTDDTTIRVKIVRDYLLFYEPKENNIYIIQILDKRRDNDKFKYFLEM